MSRLLSLSIFVVVLAPVAPSQIAFQPAVPLIVPGLAGPRAAAAGDVDADHDVDLAVAFATSNVVAILANDGLGALTLVASVPVGSGPRAVVLADLDGDGDLDAATANETASTVSVVWNGGAAWTAGPSIPCGTGPRFLHAVDLDEDGDPDLLSSDTGGNTMSVILNQSGGSFSPASSQAAGSSPREIASGDFDGDGHVDLVVASANTNQILLFAGSGSGVLGPPVATPSGAQLAVGLATGDVDGDGDLDVVSSNFLAPSLTVYANGGTGTFVTSTAPLGTHFQDVVLADFDFDGHLDAAAIDVGFNHVRFGQNLGTGVFAGGQQVPVGSAPSTLTVADLDGDFIPDLVTADFGAGLSLLFNALTGPVMGPAGAGNTPDGAGGLFDAVLVNGTAGGAPRRVDIVASSMVSIDVVTPPLAIGSAPFLLWATLGAPTRAMEANLPLGIGPVSFLPTYLDPSNPSLFVIANGFFQDPAALFTPPSTPWTIAVAAPSSAFTVSVQGIVQDSTGLHVTNGVILQIQ